MPRMIVTVPPALNRMAHFRSVGRSGFDVTVSTLRFSALALSTSPTSLVSCGAAIGSVAVMAMVKRSSNRYVRASSPPSLPYGSCRCTPVLAPKLETSFARTAQRTSQRRLRLLSPDQVQNEWDTGARIVSVSLQTDGDIPWGGQGRRNCPRHVRVPATATGRQDFIHEHRRAAGHLRDAWTI